MRREQTPLHLPSLVEEKKWGLPISWHTGTLGHMKSEKKIVASFRFDKRHIDEHFWVWNMDL